MKIELIDKLAVANELGEGVIWDPVSASVWWTDIEGYQLYSYHLQSKSLQHWPTPERVGCFAPVRGQDYFIVGFESGFAYFNPKSGWNNPLCAIESDLPNTRLNDGRTDRQGRFWAGSMVEKRQNVKDFGALYCLNQQLQCAKKIPGLLISNGLCWSPDSRYLYHTDTPTRRIMRYHFDAQSAEISKPETFVVTEKGCMPDGSIVDAEGYLWNAQWGGSQVVRYSPLGEIAYVLKVPVRQPSCVAFGGDKLDMLLVTSARQGQNTETLKDDPDAGSLLIYQTSVAGIVEAHFDPNVS